MGQFVGFLGELASELLGNRIKLQPWADGAFLNVHVDLIGLEVGDEVCEGFQASLVVSETFFDLVVADLLTKAVRDVGELRQHRSVVAVGDVQDVLDDLAFADGGNEVLHVVWAILEVVELGDGLAVVVVGLGFCDEAAFAMDDIADAGSGGLAVDTEDWLIAFVPVHVLHWQATIVEEDRCVAIVLIKGQLVVGGLAIIGVTPASAEAHDALWSSGRVAERPAGDVELVRSLVADIAIAVAPLPVPIIMELLAADGFHWAWGGPEVVIDVHILWATASVAEHLGDATIGIWLDRGFNLADALASLEVDATGKLDFADVAFFDPIHGGCPAEVGTALHAVLEDEALAFGVSASFDELAAFRHVVADGLFHIHVFAIGDAGHGD